MPSFIKRIFHKKVTTEKPPSGHGVVSKLPSGFNHTKYKTEAPVGRLASARLHLETPQIFVGVAQSAGLQRDKNEDAVFTLTTTLVSNDKPVNFGLYIVADGMGGHDYGELASNLAVRKLAAYVIESLFLPSISQVSDNPGMSIQEIMQVGIMEAHQAIREQATGGGTTLTAALILGEQLTLAHVGDSRAYSIQPDGQLQLLTHDHTLVKRLEEIGQITPDEASHHPKRNLLYRALGQGEQFEPDITNQQVVEGYQLMLCSDGLWGVIDENEISDIIRLSREPQVACQSLVNTANSAGGPDNISVIIIHLSD